MAIRFYDEALVNKISKWIEPDSPLVILKPNETARLFQIVADETNDKPITLPLVAISRDPNIDITIPTKRPLTFNGLRISEYDGEDIPEEQKIMQLDAIPIVLNYQIDIYTKEFWEADEYIRNFVFQFVNYPKMVVEIPYNNAKIQHVCYTHLQPQVSDNSDIPQKLFPDQFTRFTFNLRIDDAYLFSVPIKQGAAIAEATGIIDGTDEQISAGSIILIPETTNELVYSDEDI